jgi:hypothetical protein
MQGRGHWIPNSLGQGPPSRIHGEIPSSSAVTRLDEDDKVKESLRRQKNSNKGIHLMQQRSAE